MRLAIFLIPLLVAMGPFAAIAEDVLPPVKTITIAADEWCPINCAAQGPRLGIGVDLAKLAFEEQGYKVVYVVMPWARALKEVLLGRIDAVVGANASDEASLVYPQTPIYDISDDFYALKAGAVSFDGIETLEGHRIGIIKGYGYNASLTAYIKRAREIPGAVQEVAGDDALEQNIRKLQAGRIDILVESRPVMDYTLRQLKLSDEIKWLGGIPQGAVYLGFSPKREHSKALAQIFDKAVAKLKAEGRLAGMYELYGLKP